MALSCIHGAGLTEDQIVSEAYAHVAEGYRRALAVRGLPQLEIDDLRRCLRAVDEIARNPRLHPIGAA
jgi:hypothetical protein